MPGQDWLNGGFGLYVHWPYCVTKCPYCDFNSHVAQHIDHEDWAKAFVQEVHRVSAETPGRVLHSIYFGGGTPSLMQAETVASVIEAARSAWIPANDLEITLEANPGSVEVGRFRGFREAGVNRVSLGIQALNDRDLQRLGRAHDRRQALAALEISRETFDRVSFDLIYARQDQSRPDWTAELQQALSMAPDHLSLYQLTIEEGTVFGRRFAAGQLLGLPSEDLAADLYLDTLNLCADAGLNAYEVSNLARPGQESRHNLVYWRGGDYAGIGPGAHGRLTIGGQRYATFSPKQPILWLQNRRKTGSGEIEREHLAPEERAEEFLLMGLRLSEGIDLDRFESLGGQPIPQTVIDDLASAGFITVNDRRLAATTTGRMVLNRLLAELLV